MTTTTNTNDNLLKQPGNRILELDIEGMTCASCVGRVERKLGKIEGVEASVNLPLESAQVTVPNHIDDAEIAAAIESAGYKVRIKKGYHSPAPHHEHQEAESHHTGQHEDHLNHGGTSSELKPRLLLAVLLTIPVFLISMIPALQFPHWGWVVATLTLPVITWAAWPFHRAAAINARHLASTMDTLVSIGVLAAYIFSITQLVVNPMMTQHPTMGHSTDSAGLYFEVASVVTTFLLLGRYLEANAKNKAGNAIKTLLSIGAKEATLIHNDEEHKVPAASLKVNDVVMVRPGEKIPADGTVIQGTSAIDTSLITGEALPVEVKPGSKVTGATINTSGLLYIQVTRVGSDTTLAQMGKLVAQAQTGKAPIARLADKISSVFVPIVLTIAVITFLIWIALALPNLDANEIRNAFTAAIAVLIIACPCALGLATPVGIMVGTGRGSEMGILIKSPQTLEDTRKINTILLDKTGTITEGKMTVESIMAFNGHTQEEILKLAGSVEAGSEHPIGRAIHGKAKQENPTLSSVGFFHSSAGGGVTGITNGHPITIGKQTWLLENNITITEEQKEAAQRQEASGTTAIFVAINDKLAGIISLKDTLKPESIQAIEQLKAMNIHPILITGDNKATAHIIAKEAGIAEEDVFAEVLPADKVNKVKELQDKGLTVAIAGDGVNDAAALAQADLGIAMGSGSDVAIEAADLTVMGSHLTQVVQAIELSRKTLTTIKTNLFWAFFYNAIGIPIAALGLLNPMIAGAAMAASSVLVVANSLRLRNFGKNK